MEMFLIGFWAGIGFAYFVIYYVIIGKKEKY